MMPRISPWANSSGLNLSKPERLSEASSCWHDDGVLAYMRPVAGLVVGNADLILPGPGGVALARRVGLAEIELESDLVGDPLIGHLGDCGVGLGLPPKKHTRSFG